MSAWQVPQFAQPFQAHRFQQGQDAVFEARVIASPEADVSWARDAIPLAQHPISGGKCRQDIDPTSGRVVLTIPCFGPEDEGKYTCTASNPYGKVTATLNLDPEQGHTRSKAISNVRLQLYHQQGAGSEALRL